MRRYRHGRRRPTFDTPIIFRRVDPDAIREAGRRRGAARLEEYRLALGATLAADPAPGDFAWIGPFEYPPPRLSEPSVVVDPEDASRLVVWRQRRSRPGANVSAETDPHWTPWGAPEVFEALIESDRRDTTGLELVRADVEITRLRGVFIVRPVDVIGLVGGDTVTRFRVTDWEIRLGAGGVAWDLLSAADGWDRARLIDLVAERRE